MVPLSECHNTEMLQFSYSCLNERHVFNEYARKQSQNDVPSGISKLFETKDRILSKTRGSPNEREFDSDQRKPFRRGFHLSE